MQLRIDPDTGNMIGLDDAIPTTYEAAARHAPPCPRCGTPVTVKPRNIDSFEATGPNQWVPGRHEFNCQCYSTEVV